MRLDRLAEMFNPKKLVHASIEYVDTPASVIQLARTGTQSAALKEMDALAHVVRTFFAGSVEQTVAALVESPRSKLSREELDRLSALIDRAKKEGR